MIKYYLLTLFLFFEITISNSQWLTLPGPNGASIFSIVAINDFLIASRNDFFMLNDQTFIANIHDLTWNKVDFNLPKINSYLVHKDHLYVSTQDGVYFTEDVGKTWSRAFTNIPSQNVQSIFINDSVVCGFAARNYLYYSIDFGKTWTKATNNNIALESGICVAASKYGDTIFVGTYSHYTGIYKTYDAGATWEPLFRTGYNDTPISFYDIKMDGKEIIAASSKGIYYSEDGGNNWTLTTISGGADKIQKVNDYYITISKDNRKIYLLKKNGLYFGTIRYSPSNMKFNDFTVSNGIIYGAATTGVYTSTDEGQTWDLQNKGLTGGGAMALCDYEGKLLVSYSGKGVYFSSDNGVTWEQKSLDPVSDTFFSMTSNDSALFGIYYPDLRFAASYNQGATWELYYNKLSSLQVFDLLNYDSQLIAASNKGLFTSIDSGKTWNEVDTTLSGYGIRNLAKNDKFLFASTQKGVLYSKNNGVNWEAVNYSFDIESIHSVHAKDSLVIAYNYEGYVYISTDYGNTWITINQPFMKISKIEIAGKLIFAAAENDNIYVSSNLGKVWKSTSKLFSKQLFNDLLAVGEYIYASTFDGVYRAKLSDFEDVSIQEDPWILEHSRIIIKPNPANDYLEILSGFSPDRIEIFDLHGNKLLEADDVSKVNIKSLSPGAYICVITVGYRIHTEKFSVIE